MLQNEIYVGRITHKKASYPGEHKAIIDRTLWDEVQQRLAAHRVHRREGGNAKETSLLAGLLFDEQGRRLTPSHASKGKRRYRYYVTPKSALSTSTPSRPAWHLPAHQIEQIIRSTLLNLMRSPARLDDALGFGSRSPDAKLKAYQAAAGRADQLEKGHQGEWRTFLLSVLERIFLRPDAIDVDLCPTGLAAEISSHTPTATCVSEQLGQEAPRHRVRINTRLKRCGGEMRLVLLGDDKELNALYPDPGLIKAVAKAQVWARQLIAGEATSIAEIAKREGTSRPHASRLLNLAFLAPDIVEAILDGRQPPDVNVEVLTKTLRLPLAWQDQRRVLGFSQDLRHQSEPLVGSNS